MDEEEVQAIKEIANQLIAELRRRNLMPPLQEIQGEVINDNGSLYKDVATFGDDQPHIQTWRDILNGNPTLWVGFAVYNDQALLRLLQDCTTEFPDLRWFESFQEVQDAPDEMLILPHVHNYDGYRGFGIYCQPGVHTLDLPRAGEFIERVLHSLPDFREMEKERDIQEIENSDLDETEKKYKLMLAEGKEHFARVWKTYGIIDVLYQAVRPARY
jgi:hypothetical protein